MEVANESGVDFVWAIHPGQDIRWTDEDRDNLLRKFESMYDLGVRAFAVFFDDISGEGTNPERQAALLNYIDEYFVKKKGDVIPLLMCPTDYAKAWAQNGSYIGKMGDLLNPSNPKVINLFFESEKLETYSTMDVILPVKYAGDLQDDLDTVFESNKALVSIHIIASSKPVRMVDVSDENLLVYPKPISDTTLLTKLNGVIQGENLFDAMSLSLFVPNKLAASVAFTSGTSIHMANYIKYVVSKTGDGKFFKKLGSEKIRSYNASVVIDCSSIAFSETNRIHSLVTIFSVLRNLSNMQLPCIDLWVASQGITRVATGVSSMDLWESNIVAALYQSLLSPCQNTCLPDCIRFASSTCNARSFDSIMMVFTNGVLCGDSRAEIKSIVSGIEMTYLGIGIGLYLCGFEDLFPTMIWNSNPNHLSETIRNLSRASMKGTQNAVPEKPIDEAIKNETNQIAFTRLVERINDIPNDYDTTIYNIKVVNASEFVNSTE